MLNRLLMMTVVLLGPLAMGAMADWDPRPPEDPKNHKMHFPQMPDPDGWDVNFMEPKTLADDWKCSKTGPVRDIHFWLSSRDDNPFKLEKVHVSIHDDDLSGTFSKPGNLLWEADFTEPFEVRPYGTGPQGWYDPNPIPPVVTPIDHYAFYQVNLVDIPDPFVQELGKVYWLDLTVVAIGTAGPVELGWKTSEDHYRDAAVWADVVSGADPDWLPLSDPETGDRLDLAFVITPEPATMCLLGLGTAFIVVARRRRQLR
jgi:hypothetical protein